MAVWGSNFVVIRVGLDHLPPLLFATLRFSVALFPAVLFLKKPDVPWRNLAAYGVLIGAGQFEHTELQTQAFFTIALAMRISGEKVRTFQYAALALAAAGIGVIIWRTDGSATPLGIGLVLLAALGSRKRTRRTPPSPPFHRPAPPEPLRMA
eukprot:gene52149-71100_t